MVYLDGSLCLEYNELVPMVMSKDSYRHHKENNNIKAIGSGGNGRKVYVSYNSLPAKFKEGVQNYYGCPYNYASRQPILQAVKLDTNAEHFYQNFTLPNGLKLPSSNYNIDGKKQINYVQRYTEAASWLNMLIRLTNDKTTLKSELNISVGKFWEASIALMKTKKVNLPYSYKRLKEKIKGYQAEGYEYLIETHKFGNDYSKKIVGEVAEALLKELLTLRNKHADTTIALEYNKWAVNNDLQPITPEAVGYWRKKWHNELILEREGMSKTYTKLSKQGKRKRPSSPLLLVNSDDNVLDVYFKAPGNDWYRPMVYVVIDAFNDYILGYAIGDTVTKELIKEAYRNANRHVMQLTGASYCWQQLQTDRWGISGKNTTELEAFYNSMAISTPAGLKNSQTKYIERSFGAVWHEVLKKAFPSNYSGHNITAKQKLNPDTLKPAYFPDITECESQVAAFINAMRQTKQKGSEATRQQEWLTAFWESEKSQQRLLTEEMRLQIFGKRHTHLNTIESKGLTPTLLGKTRTYELTQTTIFKHAGKKVQVIYDEADLSTVLVTDGKGLRFLANEYKLLPSAIADYEPGDRERINNLLSEKKTLLPKMRHLIDSRKSTLERAKIDAESRIQAGVLTKEISHPDHKLIASHQTISETVSDDDDIDIYADMLNK